jgi:hypothetical protein
MGRLNQWAVLMLLMIACLLLVGCLDEVRYKMPCRIPQEIQAPELVGSWQLEYRNFINSDSESAWISGTETVTIVSNGMYVQVFDGPEHSEIRPLAEWRLITDEGDGPKLAMTDLRYYANGIEYSNGPLLLRLQTPDQMRYHDTYPLREQRQAKTIINYPADGFVYLYPRHCLGKLVLLQMVSGSGDPDDLTVHNPVFTKIGE